MARLFLTKVWGFSPESYPALGFNTEGGRLKFLRDSEPGDWVVLVGTLGKPTEHDDRGRLLGKVQLGPEQIDVEEVVESVGTHIPGDHYIGGRYRWPFGFPIISAQRFVGKPDLATILGNYLPGNEWVSYALDVGRKLGLAVQAKLESLPTETVDIVEAPAIVRQRERQRALVLNSGTTGPGPSASRSGSERISGAASAYVFELHGGRRTAYKIGYSADVTSRLASLNKGLVSSVTGCSWSLAMRQEFETEKQAYDFEQILHKRIRQYLIDNELEIYSIERKDLDRAWGDAFIGGDWAV